jgi:hypothetical protein
VLAAAATLQLAPPARAETAQHAKQSLGPFVADAPAGALCDFAYHEQTSFTQNTTYSQDLITDEVNRETPNAKTDVAATLCPALGGASAA